MGKTKVKTIQGEDTLVAKLKEELGMPEGAKKGKGERVKGEAKKQKKQRSKKYLETSKVLNRTKTYPISEALDLVKKLSYAKFNSTLEAHINTVTTNLRGLVSLPFQTGKTEYKTEPKAPVIHLSLGKLNQPTEELEANIKTLLSTLGKTKIKKVTLSPTMGPGVKLDLTSL